MKIKPEHYQYMKEKINAFLRDNPNIVREYETGKFPRSDKVKDLQTRFSFDMKHYIIKSSWVCENLYPYMDDKHIATALKNICPKITKRY